MAMNQVSGVISAPVKVGVVGYGWWGRTIAAQLRQSAWFELVGVHELSASLREQMAGDELLRGVDIVADFEGLLQRADLEAVILCTPHQQHAQQIGQAAQAGKHVFCEKPLCLTLADAEQAIAHCVRHQRVLGIGHERRFEPAVMALRDELAAGRYGEVLQIEANFSQDKFFALPKDNWRLSNRFAPVGPLTATGIHLVDLAIAILGPCASVWARLSTLGSEFENGDTLGVMMAFPSGANALISAILATPFEGRFAVYGSKGWFEIRDRTHPESPSGWDVKRVIRGQDTVEKFVAPYPAVRANLEAFAGAIRGQQAYPVSHQEMLANVAALEAIMRSVGSRTIETVQTGHLV
jgi:predicted dehydrogenase